MKAERKHMEHLFVHMWNSDKNINNSENQK